MSEYFISYMIFFCLMTISFLSVVFEWNYCY